MGGTTRGVLLFDADEALPGLRASLEQSGVPVHSIRYSDETLPPPGSTSPAVIVIGPGVSNAPAAARRLCALHPAAHVVFAADPSRHDELRRVLMYAAPPNTPWKLVAADPAEAGRAVLAALEASRRSAQVRTTLDRVNLRLSEASAGDARDYRRLVVSDHYLASVLRHVQDAIVSLDLQGNVLSWNAGAAHLLGIAAAEAIGAGFARLAAWSVDPHALLDAAARDGYVRSELRVQARQGDFILDATFTAIEGGRGEVIAIAAILRDITERKRTEAELAANEARFRAVADNIPQLAWMTDEAGTILWFNRRWIEYTGVELDDSGEVVWKRAHHPDHVERVAAKFSAHIETGAAWEDTFPLRSRDGEYRWFLSRAFPIRDAAGNVTHWFGTNTDITEERAAQQALREADRRKNEFISVLSHELRNPLAPIRSSIFLLDRHGGDEAVARKARAVIARQTEHLTRLVDDLLDVTRIARGKIELLTAPLDLVPVVRGAVEDYRPVVEAAGLRLEMSLPDAPLHAEVDAARIAQVLGNLVQNSVKFTPEGGTIGIAMEAVGPSIRIAVRDSGIGIEPALLSTLFEPFVQGERSLARSKGGLGLGLALARGIVDMHGGRLEAHSDGTDQGALFTIWLPASVARLESAPGESATNALPRFERRVLIVDDNRDAADSLAQLVRLFGHQAAVAYDGPSALVSAREYAPEIVLCDIGLPGMDGYEVARRMRAEHPPVRMVAVSGYAQAENRREAAEAGFEEHVAKPPKPEDIQRLLG